MKKRLLTSVWLVLATAVSITLLNAQEINPQQGPQFESPVIAEDNTVTFTVHSPTAQTVTINGSWMGWGETLELKKGNDGLWSVTVGPLEEYMYHYNFFIDSVSAIDPKNPHALRDGVRYASMLIVPGKASEIFEINDVPHGTLSKVWYDSPSLDLKRRMYVYTPPGYESSTEQYPVFYLLHGGGGDEDAWTSLGRTNFIMDNLIAAGKALPMIVVMTNGNAFQTSSLKTAPDAPELTRENYRQYRGLFEKSLVKDVIPFIEKNFRVKASKENRAIAGLSMGGGHTVTATTEYPDVFGYIGVFSAGIWEANTDMEDKFLALKNSGINLYWVGCGKEDFVMESNKRLLETLEKTGIEHEYHESAGGHTWANWRDYLSIFAPKLFK